MPRSLFVGIDCLQIGIAGPLLRVVQIPAYFYIFIVHSHVDGRYKTSLLKTMVDRAYRPSSTKELFEVECKDLRLIFFSTILSFTKSKLSNVSSPPVVPVEQPLWILLPFKDQKSADVLTYDTKFFISLFKRALKMMKNGVYFIRIALFVAELLRANVQKNQTKSNFFGNARKLDFAPLLHTAST